MPFRPPVHVPLILGGVGVVFFTVGVLVSFSHSAAEAAARGASLGLVTASTLRTRSLGEVVLVEGKLATSNRAGFRDFVVYHRDRFAGVESSGVAKGQEKWTSLETVTPPLIVEVIDGSVTVVNAAYEMRNASRAWRDVDPSSNILGREGERAYGFGVGDVVTVEGRVVESPSSRAAPDRDHALEALTLTAGDRAAYLAYLNGGVIATRIIGAVFTGLGVLLALLAAWMRGRLSRELARGER